MLSIESKHPSSTCHSLSVPSCHLHPMNQADLICKQREPKDRHMIMPSHESSRPTHTLNTRAYQDIIALHWRNTSEIANRGAGEQQCGVRRYRLHLVYKPAADPSLISSFTHRHHARCNRCGDSIASREHTRCVLGSMCGCCKRSDSDARISCSPGRRS